MKNKVYENLVTRRSVRSFTDKHISKEDLEVIMEAAVYAPSGMFRQSWHFTVLQNKELMQELAHVISRQLKMDEAAYNFYSPDTLILASNDRDNANGLADCACALQNIFLMSHELGIGSVWINQLRVICDEPEIRKVLDKLEVPSNHVVCGMAALGYPAVIPKVKKRNFGVIKYIN